MNLLFDADGTKNKWWQVTKLFQNVPSRHPLSAHKKHIKFSDLF